MKEKKPVSLQQFYEELESTPDERTLEQVCADLKELGVNPDDALSRLEQVAQAHLKEDRLAWKQDAAEKKSAFEKVKERIVSWAGAPVTEIEEAFQKLINSAKPDSPSFAFRNRTNLSSQDKARLLDSLHFLRQSSQQETNSSDDSAGT